MLRKPLTNEWRGVFAIDVYVGSRFQHWPALPRDVNQMLALLPDRLLRRPSGQTGHDPRILGLIRKEELIVIDPTEAVDSGNILPAIRRVFQAAETIPTGGGLYFNALNAAFHKFVTEDDLRLLHALLMADEALGRAGETQYAIALAMKP